MAQAPPKRPNILFILSDDQGWWTLRCAGNREIETPNLDRLAATGTRFDRFFCASPVCSPARATILTGRIPSRHGVHDWLSGGNSLVPAPDGRTGELIEYLAGQPGYTDYLAAAGYQCGISGKWHLGDSHHPQKSYEFWRVHAKGGGPYYNAPMIRDGQLYHEPRYVTDAITDTAIEWLQSRKTDARPFCMDIRYTAPHSPWTRENHPADLYDRYHRDCPFASAPDGLAPPEWAKFIAIPIRTPQERRTVLSGYYAAITAMDANIGRLLDCIEANGLREDTLVLFTSDNGMNMGHHGIYGKGNATFPLNMYEESVRVPFLASRLGHVPQGAVNTDLLSQYDLLPTILDYAGVRQPDDPALPGRSFAETLRGDATPQREPVVVFDEYGPVRMIRDRDWKYVHRFGLGPDELYHLAEDPAEQHNLAADPARARLLRDMHGRLTAWFERYSDPDLDGSRLPVSGCGQTHLCGPSGQGRQAFHKDKTSQIIDEMYAEWRRAGSPR